MLRSRLWLSLGVALALLVGGCGGGGDGKASSTTRRTTSTVAAATTAAPAPAPPADLAPLTGLPQPDPAKRGRVALVVKIDNAPKARPQIGINEADIIVEEMVEGGITRLASFFHSTDSDPVGPVRSARSSDIAIVGPLNHPLFAY